MRVFLNMFFLLWDDASPVPPHWSVSLFALQFGWAGLSQFQSLLPCGCGLQSVVVGRCPASCCPVCSSPTGEKDRQLAENICIWWQKLFHLLCLQICPDFMPVLNIALKKVSALLNFQWCGATVLQKPFYCVWHQAAESHSPLQMIQHVYTYGIRTFLTARTRSSVCKTHFKPLNYYN